MRFATLRLNRPHDTKPNLDVGYRLVDSSTNWSTLNPQWGYNFDELKDHIAQFPTGTQFIYCLSGTPRWCSSRPDLITKYQANKEPGWTAPATDNRYLYNFIVKLLNEIPQIIAVEGRNEPSSIKHWSGTPLQLADEQNTIYRAAKSVGRYVIVGSSAENYDDYTPSPDPERTRNNWMREYFSLTNHFDALCFHCYPKNFQSWDRFINYFKSLRFELNLEKPLWCTEIGFSTWAKYAGNWDTEKTVMFIALSYLYNEARGIDLTVTHNLNYGKNAQWGERLSMINDDFRGAFNRIGGVG